MRRADRNLWLCLLLSLSVLWGSGCSLIVDFPSRPDADGGKDVSGKDGGRDSARDTGSTKDDSGQPATSCDVSSSARCEAAQLCCDRQDGNGPTCVDTSGDMDCSACNVGCTDEKAPNCGGRTCECEAGSAKGCGDGQTCLGTGASARCVQCMVDADCGDRTDNLKQCVGNKCVECDRGPLAADPSDDQGCTPALPICNSTNACTGCSVSPNDCPDGMQCNPEQGCFGCRLNVPISMNGCGGTSPVCASVTVAGAATAQCRKCMSNSECSGGYCVEATGECVNGCDPDQLPGANACAPVTPICSPGETGLYNCTVCKTSAECAGLTASPLCATSGTQRGQCVQCRNNGDCSATGTGDNPVCTLLGASAGTCRPRTASDCTGQTPRLSPSNTCVACLPATQAADCRNPQAPLCNPTNFTCGQCATNADCVTAAAPICNTMTNRCAAGCTLDAQCASQPNTTTPFCDATAGGICVGCKAQTDCTAAATPVCSPTLKTCVACNAEAAGTADTLCSMKSQTTPLCIMQMSNPKIGTCGACDVRGATTVGCAAPLPVCNVTSNSCVTCDDATEAGCFPSAPECIAVPSPGTGFGCNVCDPIKPVGTNGCAGTANCIAGACVPVVPDAGI